MIIKSLTVLGLILLIAACTPKPEPSTQKVDFTRQMEHYYPLVEEVLTQRELSPAFFGMLEGSCAGTGISVPHRSMR